MQFPKVFASKCYLYDKKTISCLYFYLLVNATTISLIQSPSGQVDENTEITLTCVTDESQPDASIVWFVGGESIEARTEYKETGMYEANVTRSELILPVNRTLNGKNITCVAVEADLSDSISLSISCKYSQNLYYSIVMMKAFKIMAVPQHDNYPTDQYDILMTGFIFPFLTHNFLAK